jgi:hypothetical protein
MVEDKAAAVVKASAVVKAQLLWRRGFYEGGDSDDGMDTEGGMSGWDSEGSNGGTH